MRRSSSPVTVGQEFLATEEFVSQLTFIAAPGNMHGAIFTWNGSDGALVAAADAEVRITLQGTRIFMPEVARE